MEDSDDAAIVSASIATAKNLGLNVIVESVETAEQLNYLAVHGCNEIQGYVTGKLVPTEEFVRFLVKNSDVPDIHLAHSAWL